MLPFVQSTTIICKTKLSRTSYL